MGAWFNALNKDLTIHRMLHVQRGGKVVKYVSNRFVNLKKVYQAFI